MPSFRIYSRNIFGVPIFSPKRRARIKNILEQLNAENADFVLLQEVFMPRDMRTVRVALARSGSRMMRPRKVGLLRFSGGLCGVIKKEVDCKHSFKKFGRSGFLTDFTMADKIAQKGFQIFEITAPFRAVVINTHLTCPHSKILDKSHKHKALLASQLSSIEKYIQGNPLPTIICGDFNIEPQQDIMLQFIQKNFLKDETAHLSTTYNGNHFRPRWLFRYSTKTKKPDYILSRNIPTSWAISARVAQETDFVSDHAGLVVEIEIAK